MEELLYDTHAVYQALTDQARKQTSVDNVADVLDALVRLTTRPADTSRQTAPYFVLIKPYAVYVKEGHSFREQGGLSAEWGRNWEPVQASDMGAARALGDALREKRFN